MNKAAKTIAQEIAVAGAVSFARFMELALYCPVFGYYEAEEDRIGAGGDFYTSASVGGLFGQLLGWQFAEWLAAAGADGARRGAAGAASPDLGQPGQGTGRLRLIEAGAHGGQLAGDVLDWLMAFRPELFERLEYWVIEPSERRRQWQRERLARFADKIRWMRDLPELIAAARSGFPGGSRSVLFCNELLDAFPVHRLGWDASGGRWFEWGVRMEGERFAWTRLDGRFEGGRSESAVPGVQDRRDILNLIPAVSEPLLAV